MVNRINTWTRNLLDGLFPHYCCLCGLFSHCDYPLCRDCRSELAINSISCDRCALPLSTGHSPDSLCGNCQQSPPPFCRAHVPWIYSEYLAHIIGQWKFHREARLTSLLADLWLEQAGPLYPVDKLVPVPLHWRRQWQRGFNQAELLARELQTRNEIIGRAQLDSSLLKRNRSTQSQSGMNADERAGNLRGAFTARRACDNLRVALVDDVLTTGATATAAAWALREAGAMRVELWCLARTPAPDT